MRFLLGFGVASLLWGAAFGMLYARGLLQLGGDDEESPAVEGLSADEAPTRDRKARPRRTRRGKSAREDGAGGLLPSGEATVGDDIGWDRERRVDMAAGEAQLTGRQIEAGFDGAMAKIRRCLVLVPSEGEVTGTLTFGMRVGPDGVPRAVNLTGPAVVTSGESGSCLRQAAQGIRFPAFDGPESVFRYPITLR